MVLVQSAVPDQMTVVLGSSSPGEGRLRRRALPVCRSISLRMSETGALARLSVTVVGVVVGVVALANLGTSSASSAWRPIFYGSVAAVMVGAVLTSLGTYMGIGYSSSGSRLAFSPIISPEMQGAGASVQF